jgi:phospholipid transport system substrate-binding protein
VLLVMSAPVGVLAEAPAAASPVAQAAVNPPEVSETPEQVVRHTVESFHAVLLEVMKSSGAASFAEREDRVAQALDGSFDMTLMAKTSIGKSWKELSEEQQRDWVALSRRYSASNYTKNFKDWSGQSFATLGVEPAARGTLVVKTELVQPADDNVKFDYRLRRLDGGWRVIDVQIDGKVSEITLRRADYRSVIERKGFERLVADVTRKIAGFERQ